DRKSTRLNSSHDQKSYAVFCLKKKREDDSCCRIVRGDTSVWDDCRTDFREHGDRSRDSRAASRISLCFRVFFFFNDTATTEIYTLSLHDALPISPAGDPVGQGLVESLGRPGGNITGVALMTTEVRARRLALFREMLPRLSRVAILIEPHVHRSTLRDVEGAAGTMGIHIEWVEVAGREQLDSLASRLRAAQVHGVYIAENPIIDGIAPRIATISRQQRLPTVFAFRDAVEAGGLMSYGASFPAT